MSDLMDRVQRLREFAERQLRRRLHYRHTFNSPSGRIVLADLKRFSRLGESPAVVSPSTTVIDPVATGIRIGRQEVMQRIVTLLNLDDKYLTNLKEDQE